jgi:hypothetical protein
MRYFKNLTKFNSAFSELLRGSLYKSQINKYNEERKTPSPKGRVLWEIMGSFKRIISFQLFLNFLCIQRKMISHVRKNRDNFSIT